MQFTNLDDSSLLFETRRLCAEERLLTLRILHLLREIDSRALYARSHPSLFEFCVSSLGFSEAQAQRRISAMRLLKNVPELESRVATGEIKISQLAQVQTFVRAERKESGRIVTAEETQSLLLSLSGMSTRETERLLLEKSPALQARRQMEERVRVVTPTHTELKFAVDGEFMALLEEAKGLLAHNANMNPSLPELFKKALATFVDQRKRAKGILPKTASIRQTKTIRLPVAPRVKVADIQSLPNRNVNGPPPDSTHTRSRWVPTEIQRLVFHRAKGRCEYRFPLDQEQCTSLRALEIHHLVPFAHHGAHAVENLRVYCRTHNAAQGKWDFPLLPVQYF